MKIYAVEVVLRKIGPAAAASAISTVLALLAAHQGLLEAWGITFGVWPLHWNSGQDPSGQVILIELDTISKVGLTTIMGLIVAAITAAGHHTTALVVGNPQSGGLRSTDKAPAPPAS